MISHLYLFIATKVKIAQPNHIMTYNIHIKPEISYTSNMMKREQFLLSTLFYQAVTKLEVISCLKLTNIAYHLSM